jgi:cysteinyl-tRNA synthetase
MELVLYNSLSGKKEVFTPIRENDVRIYACGPTVYNFAHIGNARMAVVFDQLARVLRTRYDNVTYVSNITDIDDKIINAANERGEEIAAITEKYGRIYNEDMAALGANKPDIQPRATEHIAEMIALIERLIERGHAYVKDGHALFHVPSFPAYGGLSRRSRDDMVAGARVEIAPYKKDAADFILWKPSTGDQPGWDSPFGFGRPGWHIECSAMAEKHLGLPFDIHGGGADLKFPHHENEIAQSCCAHGHTEDLSEFAKVWVHNGFVTVNGEKMSKSIGNIALVHELKDHFDGEILRWTLLSAHYRQPLDWSENAINQSKACLDRLYQALKALDDVAIEENAPFPDDFISALYDDLNTPKAFAALIALSKQAAAKRTPLLKAQLIKCGHLLGLLQADPDSWLGYGQTETGDIDTEKLNAMLEARNEARARKDYAAADKIRDEMAALGFVIEDTPEGAIWKKKS